MSGLVLVFMLDFLLECKNNQQNGLFVGYTYNGMAVLCSKPFIIV